MHLFNWLPAAAWAISIFIFSHQSRPPGSDLGPDYILHALAYGLFGLCIVWGKTSGLIGPLDARAAILSWVIAILYGATDEFHQSFIPGRNASWADWIADCSGSGLVILCVYLLRGFLPRRARR